MVAPDGSPLQQPPCDRSGTKVSSDDRSEARAIVVRFTNIPEGADKTWWINEANGGSQGRATRDGNPIGDLSETVTLFPPGVATCTVRFKVAAGPWDTVRTWGKSPGAVGSRDGASYIFGQPLATKNGTAISVTHNIQDRSVRLVAFDGDDNEHPGKNRSGSSVKDFQQLVVEFDLTLDQIKGFRVQSRPFDSVEIPGIALKRK